MKQIKWTVLVKVVHGQVARRCSKYTIWCNFPKGFSRLCSYTDGLGWTTYNTPSFRVLPQRQRLQHSHWHCENTEEKATLVHHTSVSEDCFIAIKSRVDLSIPKGLINKARFHVLAHFGCRENKGNRSLKPTLFNIKGDENQPEQATRFGNERTKNHDDPKAKKKGSTEGLVYKMHCDPR